MSPDTDDRQGRSDDDAWDDGGCEFLDHGETSEAASAREAALGKTSVCSYCGVGCPYTVVTDKKGVDRIEPLSPLGLCVKGKTSLMTGGDAERVEKLARRGIEDDRIRAPMIRGHDGKMKVVSWEEALDRAAWLFLHVREWVGPEAVAIYGNGQKTLEAIYMASLYKLVFRLPTIGANSEHCLASAGAAHEQSFGNEASFTAREFEELELCDVAVLHGTNAFITFPQAYEKLKRNAHARKVVIDPVRTDTVSDLQASDDRTLHIRFRAGGDVMFNLAVSRVILAQGWEDREYLDRAVDPDTVAELTALCNEPRCAPDAVARAIALEGDDPAALEATIREYAELLARPGADGVRPKVAIVSSMGINQSTGSYGFCTNLNLLLLTGNVGRPGAGSLRIAGQSNATSELMLGFNARRLVFNLDPERADHREELSRLLDLPEENIPREAGTSVSKMADDDRLYCFLFLGTQMTRNMPRLGHWMRRMGRAFNVVIDPFLGDGVLEYADVVLPSLTYTERTGVIQRGDRSLQLQQRVTEPPLLAWSDEQILARLALAIAGRLKNPDTALLNELDPDVVESTFGRFVDAQGQVDSSVVFDHMVDLSCRLDLYNRMEDAHGARITHDMLRRRAGTGVQWQGDGRYTDARTEGEVFPGLRVSDVKRAKLVRPHDGFLADLARPMPPGTVNLLSGRGRPGRRGITYRARYNSGVKTLPITGRASEDYNVELHPDVAAGFGVEEGQLIRLTSGHGAAIARVALNDRISTGTAYIDFVPGEINRLTDYVDSDRFTSQSLIKRTPVTVRALSPLEDALWARPDADAFASAVGTLYREYRAAYPTDEDWLKLQRREADAVSWLPASALWLPQTDAEHKVAEAAGAMTVFIQQFVADAEYRAAGGRLMRSLPTALREEFLLVLLPLLRRLDYQSAMHLLLSELVGGVRLLDEAGETIHIDLLTAHKSAVLEFKEEIVAIQLFIAAKRAVDLLFGEDAVIRREDLAFVSGVAIPCAGDVPAHFVGMSPADIGTERLIHSRAIGSSALMVIDRRTHKAVRVDVLTGVLPKDRELTKLRGAVINRKRAASTSQHARFFDRLGELIVEYVRTGDANFAVFGPVTIDWEEYRTKLTIVPAKRTYFHEYLVQKRVSVSLARSLEALGVLDGERDAELFVRLAAQEGGEAEPPPPEMRPDWPLRRRVDHVVETIIEPVLANDGGRLDVLEVDEERREVVVRFVGSCANCPYSLLSMEQLVNPSLLAIEGIDRVTHRALARDSELKKAREGQAALEIQPAPAKGRFPILVG